MAYAAKSLCFHEKNKGWSDSAAGRAFPLHGANLSSIPPTLSESPAHYQEYLAHTAEPDKLPLA